MKILCIQRTKGILQNESGRKMMVKIVNIMTLLD